MPVHPIGSKPTNKESIRLSLGAIVEYEHSGKALLGAILGEKRGKWLILNQRAREAELTSDRLYLYPGKLPEDLGEIQKKAEFLDRLAAKAEQLADQLALQEVWELLVGETSEVAAKEVTELLYKKDTLLEHIAVRRALLNDKIYFKRKKLGFEPREADVVEELKVQRRVEAERRAKELELIESLVARLKAPSTPGSSKASLPSSVEMIEQLAAVGSSSEQAKEASAVVHEVLERTGLELRGKPEQKAFELLVAVKHFSPDENLGLHRFKRLSRFSDRVNLEAEQLLINKSDLGLSAHRLDLTHLEILTIDSESTRDIDDAISYEALAYGHRVGIHISDAAAYIDRGSALETLAFDRATSIYCPNQHIPMLPPVLSESALSLVQGIPRMVVSFFIELDTNHEVIARSIGRSRIIVKHRLNYEQVDRILFDETISNDPDPGLLKQLLLALWNVTCKLEERRLTCGATNFPRRELSPVIGPDGKITLEDTTDDNPSRKLVGELMILANETAALFAADNNIPLIFRGQEPPEIENINAVGFDIPEGPAREYYRRSFIKRSTVGVEHASHFGLGLKAYAQVTSPIRRASDLINQRQLISFIEQRTITYPKNELSELLGGLENGLHEANIIQRESTRYWLFKYLLQEGIKQLRGTVVKVDGPKPLAEVEILYSLFYFRPVGFKRDGSRDHGKKVGEQVLLEIQEVNPRLDLLTLVEVVAPANI